MRAPDVAGVRGRARRVSVRWVSVISCWLCLLLRRVPRADFSSRLFLLYVAFSVLVSSARDHKHKGTHYHVKPLIPLNA